MQKATPMVNDCPSLQELLRQKNLSQREVARRMGIAQQHLNRMIQGHRPFPLRLARAFAMATGIPLAVTLAAIERKPSQEPER